MIKVEKLNPFGRMCISLGMLPSSYKESLTYEEQLLWFFKFLDETVIPTVNNNADAVEELQALYIQVKTFVDEYFDNLDVQEEINNKLDDMADSGELADIIAQYLGLAGVLAFDKVSDLKAAENIVNGSICKTLGYSNITDGKGAFYKIRTITSGDVVDENNIIALSISDTLIAQKILTYNETIVYPYFDVLKNGEEVKIKVAPIDPYDAFRGRYVSLWYDNDLSYEQRQGKYGILEIDEEGFATVKKVEKKRLIWYIIYCKKVT